jgi:hypothetical protein
MHRFIQVTLESAVHLVVGVAFSNLCLVDRTCLIIFWPELKLLALSQVLWLCFRVVTQMFEIPTCLIMTFQQFQQQQVFKTTFSMQHFEFSPVVDHCLH